MAGGIRPAFVPVGLALVASEAVLTETRVAQGTEEKGANKAAIPSKTHLSTAQPMISATSK